MYKNSNTILATVFSISVIAFNVSNAFALDAAAENTKSVNEQLVDTMTNLAGGPHTGYRSNHAKGIVVLGEFVPAKSAAQITKAAHLQSTTSKVVVRFSNATGVPTIADADGHAFPKGIAIRFTLPDNTSTDIVSISTNGFPASTPEDFLGLLNAIAASGPEVAKPLPVEQFLGTHPAAKKFVEMPKPAPVSFATQAFYGVNAFKFTNAKGESQYARYRIMPVAGQQFLTAEAAKKAGPNYLMEELPIRLAKKPVQFKLIAQLAQKGDNVNDATAVWPESRKQIVLGTLSLKTVDADGNKFEKSTMFNPLSLVGGIEASADPVLLARPGAYAVSYGRRLNK